MIAMTKGSEHAYPMGMILPTNLFVGPHCWNGGFW